MVSQRATSLTSADMIIVMDDGEIASIGTHDELIEKCRIYNEIYNSQLSQKEDDEE